MTDLFMGSLVRLVVPDEKVDSALIASWERNSAYHQYADSRPARPIDKAQQLEWMQAWLADSRVFMIHTLADDRTIGVVDLNGFHWAAGDAWLSIGIGDPGDWDKGYGTDALRILARLAFEEYALNRLSLTVFDYNPRGIRSYEKLGFEVEGRARDFVRRSGRYWDMVYMVLWRSTWEGSQASRN